ncbi:heavy-metal-associated domain-containing protein [Bacillus tuaregi]|uniref:heavy-metal-associated domain-containing protein n=1 Tax=Bacillus tuaregi TaxID=1816695 RepID=UPI0008F7EBEE|nr:heavy-metal-associated domain-containing protein [Bacillus tuaregi]
MAELTLFVKEAIEECPIHRLETALMVMNGIERALVDVQDGEVKIKYNDKKISQDNIKTKIEECGFHLVQ